MIIWMKIISGTELHCWRWFGKFYRKHSFVKAMRPSEARKRVGGFPKPTVHIEYNYVNGECHKSFYYLSLQQRFIR